MNIKKISEIETIFKFITDFILILDNKGKILYVNPTVLKRLNYSKEEILNKNVSILHPPDQLKNVLSTMSNILEGKIDLCLIPLITKEGNLIPVETKAFKGKWESEEIIFRISRDITERALIDEKLRYSEEKYSNLFQFSNDAIFLHDLEANIIDVNQKVLDLFGYKKSEILSLKISDLHPSEELDKSKKAFEEISRKGFVRFQIKFMKKNGDVFPAEVSSSIIEIRGKKLVQGIFRDITKRLQAEQKIKESFISAEFYKDLFAHDIHNILQGILLATDISKMLLDKPNALNKLKENLNTIKDQVFRGNKLIKNVQRLSELEETKYLTNPIEINNILDKSITFLRNLFQNKDIIIQLNLPNGKLFFQANELLQDVFENILINAVRYNENATIKIIIRISKTEENGIKYLKTEILDNGIGIEDIRKDNIFQRSYTEDKKVRGMGLGLSLVYKIIKSYKGKIWVENRVKDDYSKGSNFIFLIPEVK
ncbi:MAG: PAS domain S-box protein [Promethearchaeota archaeon]